MKNKILFASLFLFVILLSFISADIGRKPTLTLDIKQNGENISDNVLICYDVFMAGAETFDNTISMNKDYPYIKEILDNKEYRSCFYCDYTIYKNKECKSWFYGLPTKIAILYPAYGNYGNPNRSITPILYKSEEFELKSGIKRYDYIYEANLNSDKTITIKDDTPVFSLDQLIYFLFALLLTIIIEVIFTRSYFLKKKNKPKRILKIILIVNLISLPILWFILTFLLNTILLFTIGEIFVVLLEGGLIYFFIKKEITFKESMKLSFINNILSLFLGGFIFMIITEFFGI